MLKEALDFLASQFHKTKEARLLNIPGDGRTAYVDQDGQVKTYEILPPPRASKVDSVEDLCAAASAYGTDVSIWLSHEAVVAITDDDDRRDRVTLPLRHSHQWKTIKKLVDTPKLDQQQFIQLLRTDLIGIGGRAELLAAVRTIKFRSSSEGTSNIQHGNESMGRTIENAVTGASAIPDQLTCVLSLYDNQGRNTDEFSVTLDLEIIASESKFRLKPLPDSLEDVQNAALQLIRDEISDRLEKVRIFYGTP